MGLNQGFKMLSKGTRRRLTPSEVSKGYIFITNDKSVRKILGKNFTCEINKQKLEHRKIDSSGRINAGREITRGLENKELLVRRVGAKIIIVA